MRFTNSITYLFLPFVLSCIAFVHADVTWDPIQQLTDVPFSAWDMAYNYGRSIGAHGDSIFIAFENASANELCIARSFDGGATWEAPIHTGVYSVGWPTLAVGTDGSLHSTFTRRGYPYRIMYARSLDAGDTWQAETLHADGGRQDIDVDSAGNLHVVFTGGSNVRHMQSTDNGSTWSGPDSIVAIGDTLSAPASPTLTVDAQSNLHIVFHMWRNQSPIVPKIRYAASYDTGLSWVPQRALKTDLASWISCDSHDKHALAFVWHSNTTSFQVYLKGSVDAGTTWTDTIKISDNAGGSDNWPMISFDAYGGMHIVWEEWGYHGIGYRYVSPDFVPDDSIIRLSNLPTYFRHPHIYCDERDRIHVAWTQQSVDTTLYQLFYRRGIINNTGVDEFEQDGSREDLLVVYPSVFSQFVTINHAAARLEIFDVSGRLVNSFCSVPHAPCPTHITWDGTNQKGEKVPAGVYILRASDDARSITRKVVYVR